MWGSRVKTSSVREREALNMPAPLSGTFQPPGLWERSSSVHAPQYTASWCISCGGQTKTVLSCPWHIKLQKCSSLYTDKKLLNSRGQNRTEGPRKFIQFPLVTINAIHYIIHFARNTNASMLLSGNMASLVCPCQHNLWLMQSQSNLIPLKPWNGGKVVNNTIL